MRIFVEITPYFNRNVADDKKYLFNCLKHILAPWRALGYKQVGGCADGAGDAAPSPARCARGRRAKRSPQRANKPKIKKQGAQKVSQNFLGGGAVTKQIGRVATASRLQSEVYGDEKARRRRGIATEPLGDCRAHLSPLAPFFHPVLSPFALFRSDAPRFPLSLRNVRLQIEQQTFVEYLDILLRHAALGSVCFLRLCMDVQFIEHRLQPLRGLL